MLFSFGSDTLHNGTRLQLRDSTDQLFALQNMLMALIGCFGELE